MLEHMHLMQLMAGECPNSEREVCLGTRATCLLQGSMFVGNLFGKGRSARDWASTEDVQSSVVKEHMSGQGQGVWDML